MTKEEIKNAYAVEQGYSDWSELVIDYIWDEKCILEDFLKHENAVIQLIQDELKKKIYSEMSNPSYTYTSGNNVYIGVYGDSNVTESVEEYKHQILNTENIK